MISLSTALVIVIVGLVLWIRTRRDPKLPPGPPRLPLIGNLLSSGPDLRVAFKTLRQRYGDIYCLYIGSQPTVILNGYRMLKEALVKNAEAFSDRPHSFISDQICEGKGILSVSGDMHKEQRTFALNTLRQFGMGRAILEKRVLEEVSLMLGALQQEAGQPLDLKELLTKSVSNIICSVVFGKRFEYTDPLFTKYLALTNENIQNVKMTGIVQIFPFLKYIPGDPFNLQKTLNNCRFTERELIMPMIQKHMENFDENDLEDFISAYIKEMRHRQERGEDTSMNVATLEKVIGDLFVAGSETTSTAIQWTIAFFLNYPEVQQRCFDEIRDHIGLERSPSMGDRAHLSYLEATIMEVLRRADIAPLAAPHATSRDVQLAGYRIPKGTAIMINLDSVLQDVDTWTDPEVFRPERFLDKSGKVFKPDEFIPFSLGRRVCLGESMARMELFLFLASLLQRFHFTSPSGKKPSLEGVLGLTHFPQPFQVIATLRT